MNLKILISIGFFILLGTGIWFLIQADRVTSSEISIRSERGERPEIILTSVYDNYQVNPMLKIHGFWMRNKYIGRADII